MTYLLEKENIQEISSTEQMGSARTKVVGRALEEVQLVTTMGHLTSELSQHLDREVIEEQIQSPSVPSPKFIEAQESFPKFVPSMENSMVILNSYTYDQVLNNISCKIVKRARTIENLEERTTEYQVLMENTSNNQIESTVENQALSQATKENISNMA